MLHRTEEQRWLQAIESADFGIWDLDLRHDLVHSPPMWKSRLGLDDSDAPDSTATWRSLVHPDDLGPMLRAMRAHLDGDTDTYEMRFRLRGRSGYHSVLSRGRAVERDEQGRPTRMIGTMIELSTGTVRPTGIARTRLPAPVTAATWSRPPLHRLLGVGRRAHADACEATTSDDTDAAKEMLLRKVADLLDVAAARSAVHDNHLRLVRQHMLLNATHGALDVTRRTATPAHRPSAARSPSLLQ